MSAVPDFVVNIAKRERVPIAGRMAGSISSNVWNDFCKGKGRYEGFRKLKEHGIIANSIRHTATGLEDIYIFWDSDTNDMIVVYSDPEVFLTFMLLVS